MQKDIECHTVALAVNAENLTGQIFRKTLGTLLRKYQKIADTMVPAFESLLPDPYQCIFGYCQGYHAPLHLPQGKNFRRDIEI